MRPRARRLAGRARRASVDGVAEWGFILGEAYWGTGLFLSGAQRVVDFAFVAMGLHRLEARQWPTAAATAHWPGSAVQEAVLRRSFERHGERLYQILWGILRDDWLMARIVRRSTTY